jgi:sRNA-binding regulator protein Hfq
VTGIKNEAVATPLLPSPRPGNGKKTPLPFHFAHRAVEDETGQHQAELFYLQKQIQSQTPMVIVLADGEHIEGCIEWYDRRTLKVRGRDKVLVFKSAIKYMYKVGENGPGV